MGIIGILSSSHFMWCICAGIAASCVYAFYVRGVLGRLIRALIESEAFSEETAVTAAELGLDGAIYRFALRKRSHFRDHVKVVGEEKRCFVEKENVDKLMAKYGRTDTGVTSLLLTLCAFLVVACIIAAFLPQIELFVKSLIS